MRIVSGVHRGRRIKVPKYFNLRPTTDFAKEGLFNVLNNTIDIYGLEVLDCFFGTGNISLEFISRGASEVTSVDINKDSYKFLSGIATEWGIENIEVYRSDVFIHLRQDYNKYDLIFADPPFDLPERTTIPDLVFENELLKEDGMLIVEHSRETDFTAHKNFVKTKKFGSVFFTFFE